MGAEWLQKPKAGTDRTPIDFLRAGAMEEVLGTLRKMTFEQERSEVVPELPAAVTKAIRRRPSIVPCAELGDKPSARVA
jgi:hypothetical protein